MGTVASVESHVMPTGIAAFDKILGGGLPRQQSIVITGAPGSGKTILTSQVAFGRAAAGEHVVLATVTSESHDKLVHDLRSLAFFDHERIGSDVFFLNAYPWVKKGPKETREVLMSTIRDRGASLLVFDGLRAIRDVWANEVQFREFLYEVNVGLLAHGCLGLFTAEYPLEHLIKLPEATTLDGIISIAMRQHGQRRFRSIEVARLRGRPHMLGEHHMRIDQQGIQIAPRLEADVPPIADFVPAPGRATFGLPELDAVLGGGLPLHSSTLLAGSTGVGKTLTALHFAAAGAHAGDKAVFVSFHEAPSTLNARASTIGLDVGRLIESGDLTLRYFPPCDIDPDQALSECLALVEKNGARRLVIDGIGEIEHSVLDPDRLSRLMPALAFKLRSAGVTSLVVKEIPKVVGLDVDFSSTPFAVTAENLLLLRHVEIEGSVRRLLSVLKMRESGFDSTVREFEITEQGVRVLSQIRAAGALTGMARH